MEGDAWKKLLLLIDASIPLDLTMEVIEEIKRSGREVPSIEILSQYDQNSIQQQNAMLIATLDMKPEFTDLVRNAPKGGDLFERIRNRALNE
jgi:hypothetical protein